MLGKGHFGDVTASGLLSAGGVLVVARVWVLTRMRRVARSTDRRGDRSGGNDEIVCLQIREHIPHLIGRILLLLTTNNSKGVFIIVFVVSSWVYVRLGAKTEVNDRSGCRGMSKGPNRY